MEQPLNPRDNRNKLCELVFEKFNVAKFYLQPSPLNAIYCEGLTSAVVVDCGESMSTAVPVVEGCLLHYGT